MEKECELNKNCYNCALADESYNCVPSSLGESEISHMSFDTGFNGTETIPEKKYFFNEDDLKTSPIKQSIMNENLSFSQNSLSCFLDDDKTLIDANDQKSSFWTCDPVLNPNDQILSPFKSPLKLRLKRIKSDLDKPRKNYKYSNRHRFKQSQVILKFQIFFLSIYFNL